MNQLNHTNPNKQVLNLPHTYGLVDTSSMDITSIESVMRQPSFGGASVTIPHKQQFMSVVDEVTPAAEAIGALNTVVALPDGRLLGDNTDWIGIRNPLRENLNSRARAIARRSAKAAALASSPAVAAHGSDAMDSAKQQLVALVVGGGGTARAAAYCVRQLGMSLVVHNRTHAKAQTIAKRFSGRAILELEPDSLPHVDAVSSGGCGGIYCVP